MGGTPFTVSSGEELTGLRYGNREVGRRYTKTKCFEDPSKRESRSIFPLQSKRFSPRSAWVGEGRPPTPSHPREVL